MVHWLLRHTHTHTHTKIPFSDTDANARFCWNAVYLEGNRLLVVVHCRRELSAMNTLAMLHATDLNIFVLVGCGGGAQEKVGGLMAAVIIVALQNIG